MRRAGLPVFIFLLLVASPSRQGGAEDPAALPAFCDVPGPDEAGYVCGRAAFTWLSTAGAPAASFAEDVGEPLPLPFAFPWYGEAKASLRVGSDGYLCFAPGAASCAPAFGSAGPAPLPSAAGPEDLLACFWEDLELHGSGPILHATVGAAPARVFVVEFTSVIHAGGASGNVFQLQLGEDGVARCMLRSVVNDRDGVATAVGSEDGTGASGLRFRHGEFAASSTGVRFCRPTAAPGAPTGLFTTPGPGLGEVTLHWAAPEGTCPAVLNVRIERAAQGGPFVHVGDAGDALDFIDRGVPAGLHRYRVMGVNPIAQGPASNEAAALALALS
jgi:hypothetical protein